MCADGEDVDHWLQMDVVREGLTVYRRRQYDLVSGGSNKNYGRAESKIERGSNELSIFDDGGSGAAAAVRDYTRSGRTRELRRLERKYATRNRQT